MNKIFSISIGSRTFEIEEGAYEELKKYLQEIKSYFETMDGSGEIIGDIENRIADQLLEKTASGNRAVTSDEVREVIRSMGSVSDFSAESAATSEAKENNKRLFRDEEQGMVAGVCAGLGAYFGVDPVWFRLLFLISIFFGGVGVIAYIILWIAIPAAKTPSEKIEMRGKTANLAGFRDSLEKRVGSQASSVLKKITFAVSTVIKRIVQIIGKILKIFVRILKYLVALAMIGFAAAIIVGIIVGVSGLLLPVGSYYVDSVLWTWPCWMSGLFLGSLALLILVPAILMVIAGISIFRNRVIIALASGLTLGGIWLLSLIVFMIMGLQFLPDYQKQKERVADSPVVSEIFEDSFDRVDITNAVKINMQYGTTTKVIVSGTEPSVKSMVVSYDNGLMSIARKHDRRFCLFCVDKRTPIMLDITAPTLKGFNLSGADEVDIAGFKGEEISGRIYNSGSAKISLDYATSSLVFAYVDKAAVSGTSTYMFLQASGYDNLIDASKFLVKTAEVEISDSPSVIVNAAKALKVSSYGEGQVQYLGKPAVEESIEEDVTNSTIISPYQEARLIKATRIIEDSKTIKLRIQ